MSWTDKDDKEVQKCLDKLFAKQKELQYHLNLIEIIINNTKKIQSRNTTSFNNNREQIIIKIPPKDMWGNNMKDLGRLKIKNECVNKITELLGELDDE